MGRAGPSWPSRPPRQVRSDAGSSKSGHTQPVHAVPAVGLLKGRVTGKPRLRARSVTDNMETRPAHTPASQDIVGDASEERLGLSMSMSRRFMAGRTPARLNHLASMHLFKSLECLSDAARPGPGISATLHGQSVYIVSTFTRKGIAMADVLPLQRSDPNDGLCFTSSARSVLTCERSDLDNVGVHGIAFQRFKRNSSVLLFHSLPDDVPLAQQADAWVADAFGCNVKSCPRHM